MKSNLKFSVVLFCIVLTLLSCENNSIDVDTTNISQKQNPRGNTKSARLIPVGDPNRNPNWDFTAQNWGTVYWSSGQLTNVANPFYLGTNIFGNLTPSSADIFPSQGWMLVSRDFGTPTSSPSYPFVMLYNKFRGILRLCVLRTYSGTTTYQTMTLRLQGNVLPKVFRFSAENVTASDANNTNTQTAITTAGVNQWMIGEFNVQGYDAAIDQFSAFSFNISEVTLSSLSTTGSIVLDGIAQPQVSSPNFGSVVTSALKFTSFAAKGFGAAKLLAGIPSVAPPTSPTTNVSELSNALAGIVGQFSGSSTNPTYNIKLNGSLTQQGTITSTAPRHNANVYLRQNSTTVAQAVQSIPWGIYDLSGGAPMQRVVDINDRNATVTTRTTTNNFISSIISYNPSISGDIISREACWVTGSSRTPFISLTSFEQQGFNQTFTTSRNNISDVGPRAIGLRITYSNGTIVYNEIPIAYTRIN